MKYQRENFNGEYDFRSRFHDGWRVFANLHEYSELLYCKRGNGRAIVSGKTIFLGEGEMLWIPPNYIHEYDFDGAEVICAVFSNDFIPLFFKNLGGRYFCVSAINAAPVSYMLGKLPEMKKENSLLIGGYLNLICAHVIEQAEFEEARQSDGILYQKVISYLARHYTENVGLAQVAKEFGYNIKYLSHMLHTLTGIHFRQLLNFYRIDHAKGVLTSGKEKSISAIAAECGFGALNTFNREFKRIVGMTPGEYRRTNA